MSHEEARSGRAGAGKRAARVKLDPLRERELRMRLRSWSRRYLGLPAAEFDDAYQGAWRKVLETEDKGRRTRNLERALRWGMRNTWLVACRRRRRRPAAALDETAEAALVAASDTEPGRHVERLEAARYVFEAMHALTERQAHIVLLRDIAALKPDEVCQRLHITRRTYRHDHALALNSVHARVDQLRDGGWCAEHRDLLVAYAEGRATAAQIQAAEVHLCNCLPCHSWVAAIRRALLAAQTSPVAA